MKLLLSVFFYIVIEISSDDDSGWSLEDDPLVAVHPCKGSTDIQLTYEPYRSPEEENQYSLWIHKKFPKNTVIKMKFDKGATVFLSNHSAARIDLDKSDEHAFKIRFFKSHEGICLHVQGCTFGVVPYIKSVNINTKEYCEDHLMGFLDSYIEGYKLQAQSSCAEPKMQQKGSCGKRQNLVIPLSVQGESQRNDWPWHVALFRKMDLTNLSRYICGGTLISSYYVLTAAHCVFQRRSGAIANLSVTLGKYNFQRMEPGTEEKEIEKVIYHENYNYSTLDNDIALLKMKTEATFSINIQPACLWNINANERLKSKPIMGTIVGWGYNDDNNFPDKLIQAEIPMIPQETCIRNKPSFYSVILNDRKFCGGILNEALACNGDSGGGFHVFIPDKEGDNSGSGSWYIRGLISTGVPTDNFECSGDHYTVFTDVDKYREWIFSHILHPTLEDCKGVLNNADKKLTENKTEWSHKMKLLLCFVVTLFLNVTSEDDSGWSFVGNPLLAFRPCNGSTDITGSYEPGRSPDEENIYNVFVHKSLPKHSVVRLKFDTDTSVILSDKSFARIEADKTEENGFTISFFEPVASFGFTIQGRTRGVVPYFKSFNINTREYCRNTKVGYLDNYIRGYKDRAVSLSTEPQGNCGRPKIVHTELIVNGASTKAGDWPWHVALYRIHHSEIKYICGGTLISNYYVLTAAHCASIRGVSIVPEALSVILGKFNLIGGDVGTQEREIYKVILHEYYSYKQLDHDIALLKLKSEVTFTDYVQPACLWYSGAYDKLPSKEILGTVVGWGFDNTDQLSPQLKKAQLPIVSDSMCIKSKPLFYSKILDEHRFCAGYIDSGVSACNGDSGSAFQVFLPDKISHKTNDNKTHTGAWYVRGIVSLTVSRTDSPICDPNYFGVYTDVSKYTQWIEKHTHNE